MQETNFIWALKRCTVKILDKMPRVNVTHPDKKGHKSKHLYDYEIMKSNTKIPGKLKSHLDFKVHKLTNGDDDRHGQL